MSLVDDIRHAARRIAHGPRFAAVVVLVLGLGLGTCVTIFSMVNAVYFKPLGFAAADRLMQVYETSPTRLCPGCSGGVSQPTLDDVRAARGFDRVEAFDEAQVAVEASGNAEKLHGGIVTPGLFDLLGIAPAIGPGFTTADGTVDGTPGVLISDRLWQQRFARARDVVGRSLRVNGIEHRIVGVMADGMRFPEFSDVWIPLARDAAATRAARELRVVARLAQGTSLASAQLELGALSAQLAQAHAADMADWSLEARPFRQFFSEGAGEFFVALLGAVCLVFAVMATNLSGLVLARTLEREPEIGVRVALGAGRGRIVRQLVVENLVLAAIGGLAALAVALPGVHLLRLALPADIPYFLDFSLDYRAAAFAFVLSAIACAGAAAWPALRASRAALRTAAGQGRSSAGPQRMRALGTLVAVEIGASVVLLGATFLLLTALAAKPVASVNYDAEGLYAAELGLFGARYADAAQRHDAIAAIRTAVEAGGAQVAVSARGMFEIVPQDDATTPPLHAYNAIAPGYASALRLPVRAGREFVEGDMKAAHPVVIVGESLARSRWPEQSAIGKSLELALPGQGLVAHDVVGVFADQRRRAPNEAPARDVYLPIGAHAPTMVTLRVRAPAGSNVDAAVRDAVRGVDADVTYEALVAGGNGRDWRPRFFALLLGTFTAMTIVAAGVGLYGLIASTVALRRREIGVRVALGARGRNVAALFLGHGAKLVLFGALPGAWVVGMLWPHFAVVVDLDGTASPWAGIALLLAALIPLALTAAWLPARRAAKMDPLVALREN